MLRKRTVFKPNLSKVAAPKPAALQESAKGPSNSESCQHDANDSNSVRLLSPTKTVTAPNDSGKDVPFIPPILDTGVDEIDSSRPISSPPPPSRSEATKQAEIDEESSKRVHEAITQLTGQKFEPIKSISLRNSANKNVKLKDLLFYNPPLTKDQKRHRKNLHLAKKNERKRLEEQNQFQPDVDTNKNKNIDSNNINDSVEMEPDEPSLVPKVKMGPEGTLILDESSTIINRKNSIKEKEAIVEDNEEIISRTNYDSYRRKPASTSQTKWSTDDTQKFYQALTIFGTDFSMMESLLFTGYRNRTELHKKFKREERMNKTKIDIALSNRISINSEELNELRDLFHRT